MIAEDSGEFIVSRTRFFGATAALFLLAAASSPAQAADPPAAATASSKAEALVRRLFVLAKLEETMDALMASITQTFSESTARNQPNITAEQREAIAETTREIMREMTPRLIDRIVPLYVETYTVEELEALIAFYETPAGRAFVDKTPGLAQKSSQVTREFLPEMEREMITRLCAKIDCLAIRPPPKQRPS